MRERERETSVYVCVLQYPYGCVFMSCWLDCKAEQSRADGFIMRKQNDSDNDDQIIILHLKEGGRRRWCGGLKREDERKRGACTQRGVKKNWIIRKRRGAEEDGMRAGRSEAIKKSLNIFY